MPKKLIVILMLCCFFMGCGHNPDCKKKEAIFKEGDKVVLRTGEVGTIQRIIVKGPYSIFHVKVLVPEKGYAVYRMIEEDVFEFIAQER